MSKIEAKKTSKKGGQDGKKSFGRPKKKFCFVVLEQLCRAHCTQREICSFFRIDHKTLSTRIMDEYGMTFSHYYDEMTDDGKTDLKLMQWKSAKKGSVPMQRWLGECVLGQKGSNSDNKSEEKNSTKIVLKTRR